MKHEDRGDEETTRSGLFFEAIRIIKEMRNESIRNGRTDTSIQCRYAVYENVPGIFSSNEGNDFAAVFQELVGVVVKEVPDISVPQAGWSKLGSICGVGDDGTPFSVAWRQHDAQYHGVPQRRKRVCVLADFGGYTAPWILFDPQYGRTTEAGEPYPPIGDTGEQSRSEVQPFGGSVSRGFEPSAKSGEGTSGATFGSVSGADREREEIGAAAFFSRNSAKTRGIGYTKEASPTLKSDDACVVGFPLGFRPENVRTYDETSTTLCNGTRPGYTCGVIDKREEPILLESNQNHATIRKDGISTALPASAGEGGGYVPMIVDAVDRQTDRQIGVDGYNAAVTGDVSSTLGVNCGMSSGRNAVLAIDHGAGKSSCSVQYDLSPTLSTTHGGASACLCNICKFEVEEND